MALTRFDVEEAKPTQAEDISALMRETFMAAYGHVAPPETIDRYMARVYDADQLREDLTQHRREVWVLRDIDTAQFAGYVQLSTQRRPVPVSGEADALEVQRCYLRTEYVGLGGADLLMQQAKARAQALGARYVHLSVYQIATRPIRFYQRHGFQITAPVRFFIEDVGFDDWLMVCAL